MQRATTTEWIRPPKIGEQPRKQSVDSATSFLSPPEWIRPPNIGEQPRKKSVDSATSFLSPPLWGEAITHKHQAKGGGRSFSSSPFGSCDNLSEHQHTHHQQLHTHHQQPHTHQQQQRSWFHLETKHSKARKVRSDEEVAPKDKYDRLKLKSGSAFAQSSALLNTASVTHLDNFTEEDGLQLRYDRLKVRGARIQQKVLSGTSCSSTSSSFSICSDGSVCNLAYIPDHPRQAAERGKEAGHRVPHLATPSPSGIPASAFPHNTEQGPTGAHATPLEPNRDLCVIVTPPQCHRVQAAPRVGGDRPHPRSPKMNVSASTSNIPVLLREQEKMTKDSSGSQPQLLGETLESDILSGTPNVPFIVPPIKMRCDHSGGTYTIEDHDIQLKVPRGAIKKKLTTDIQIGVCLHGPFAFPPGMLTMSPLVWLHVGSDTKLAKPIEIKIPHCLQFRAAEGGSPPSRMQFLRASCKMRAATRGQTQKYLFSEMDCKGSFTFEESFGILATKQSSFLCIAANNTPATISQSSYCLIPVLPRPISGCTWKIQCCVTYFLKTCIQAVERQFEDHHEVLPLHKFHFAENGTDTNLSVDFERSIERTGWLLALESSQTISPSDVNFTDPTHLMESLNLYPPRFTIRVHGEEATGAAIVCLTFRGSRETINVETVLPLRRQGCQVPSRSQTPTHCASCCCTTTKNGEHDFQALNGKLADNGKAATPSSPNPSSGTPPIAPTDKELERVAQETIRRLGAGWLRLHTHLNIQDYHHHNYDLQSKEPGAHLQLLEMLKTWRSTSQECTTSQLAACLKKTDNQLLEVANWLVHGQIHEQE